LAANSARDPEFNIPGITAPEYMLYVITFSSRSDSLTCGEAGWQNTRVITIEKITVPVRVIRICFLPFAVCHGADLSRQPSSVDRYLGAVK
jgi:hypothetical protein